MSRARRAEPDQYPPGLLQMQSSSPLEMPPDPMPNQPQQAIQPQQAAVAAQQPQGIQQIAPPQAPVQMQAQVPQLETNVPQAIAGSPDQRAMQSMNANPDVGNSRDYVGRQAEIDAKRRQLYGTIYGTLPSVGIHLGDDEQTMADFGKHISGAMGYQGQMSGGRGLLGLIQAGRNHANQSKAADVTAAKTGFAMLKFLAEHPDSGYGELAGKALDIAKTEYALRKDMAGEDQKDETIKRLTQNHTDAEIHRAVGDAYKTGMLTLHREAAPHSNAALDAVAGLHGTQNLAAKAGLPYVASQAGAKLSLTRALGSAVGPRTAAMMSGATGLMPEDGMLGGAGVVPAPPPDMALPAGAPGAGGQGNSLAAPPSPYTPKFQDAQKKTAAAVAHEQTQDASAKIKDAAALATLRKRADIITRTTGKNLDQIIQAKPEFAVLKQGQTQPSLKAPKDWSAEERAAAIAKLRGSR